MDIITPTPERLRKHPDWDTPLSDRKTKRAHHRSISVVEGMHRRGWATDEGKQAFEIWTRQLERAERIHVPMCNYGRPFVSADNGIWSPEDAKTAAVFKVRDAVASIGHDNTARALTIAALRECTLESIGREVSGEGNKTAAIAAAKQLMQIGLHRLAIHYQLIRGP
jgi:hypothetical protein